MHLRREQIARLGRLLWMRYRPSELAAEIGCHVDTVYRSWIPAGCPHTRDEHGRIWIVGTEFAEWARALSSQNRTRLGDGEAFCVRCRQAIVMSGPITVKPTNKYLELMSSTCSICNTPIYRARARKNSNENKEAL